VLTSFLGILEQKKRRNVDYLLNSALHAAKEVTFDKVLPTKDSPLIENDTQALKIEREYVHEVYDVISSHFSHTRYKMWPQVQSFLLSLSPWSSVLDAGCGNGKYLGANSKLWFTGFDITVGLLNICRQRGFEVLVADNTKLPFKDKSFDAVVCIAVLHHIATPNRRLQAIQEMARVLKFSGQMLIYVWSFEYGGRQDKTLNESQEAYISWNMPTRFKTSVGDDYKDKGVLLRKAQKEIQYVRYYHLFKQGELENLMRRVPGLKVIEQGFDHENWWAISRKSYQDC